MLYNVEWDPEKARSNRIKHNVSFELASSIFHDSNALTIYDDEHSGTEDRWITLGIAKNGVLLVVCHTFLREEKEFYQVRIFSARKATKFEILKYKDSTL